MTGNKFLKLRKNEVKILLFSIISANFKKTCLAVSEKSCEQKKNKNEERQNWYSIFEPRRSLKNGATGEKQKQ